MNCVLPNIYNVFPHPYRQAKTGFKGLPHFVEGLTYNSGDSKQCETKYVVRLKGGYKSAIFWRKYLIYTPNMFLKRDFS